MHQKYKNYFLFVCLLSYFYHAQACTEWLAKAVSVDGLVDSQSLGQARWRPVNKGHVFCEGDKVRTSKNSRATLLMGSQSRMTLDQKTTLIFLKEERKSASWFLQLINGGAFFRSRQTQHLNIRTPFINAVHEGTEFLVSVGTEQTDIMVFDGQVSASNEQGEVLINKGFVGIGHKGQPPRVEKLTIHPIDAVQWTLYYPPMIDLPQTEAIMNASGGEEGQQKDVQELIRLASQLLKVGRVDKALILIDQVQAIEGNNGDAKALLAIISVAKNQTEEALQLALQSIALNPQSVAGQMALSYAYQSQFQLDKSLNTVQQAVKLAPNNALVWSRLAELQFSTGAEVLGLQSAEKAKQLSPQLGRTSIILGFASLAQVDLAKAEKLFTQAMSLNSADPLVWLGLGLVNIRQGKLKEGMHLMETAVSLDPDNAILRSYLGKAYYELKNETYAATELDIAKDMDPKDPTPWFYDAILKQTINRPVEALHSMQTAIELNDNRAVYRSRLLLDEDLAARSASLGRIYNDLGFERLGLIEAWKSVNRDPSNYSAHRLLADIYASQPRHEIARVSELLQSQLLQSNNIVPVQPQLAESQLGILDGAGPTSFSFNEFNPLFSKNSLNFQANAIVGGHNTWGEDGVISGIFDNFSFSLGQFHFQTDGYRDNNDQKKDLYNAFFQLGLSNRTSIQFEYRHANQKNGDVSLGFDRTLFSSVLRESKKGDIYRLGFHHVFSEQSEVIVSALYNRDIERQDNKDFQSKAKTDGFLVEAQHILNINDIKVISGAGAFRAERESSLFFKYDLMTCGLIGIPNCLDKSSQKIAHDNGYIYSYFPVYSSFNVTLGLSINSVDNEFEDKVQYNPKIGLSWEVMESLQFRAAAFRTVKRNLLGNQTIEPTQIAGFNQLYDDFNSTDAWNYGVALDFKFSKGVYGGVEFFLRDLNVAYKEVLVREVVTQSTDWHEHSVKAYFNWAFHPQWALGIDYRFERFDWSKQLSTTQSNGIGGGTLSLQNHVLPLSINWFHPSGLSGKLRTSYYVQSGTFSHHASLNTEWNKKDSSFWIVDIGVGYRLPKRLGKISLNVLNLLDTSIHYEERDSSNPRIAPERTIVGSVTFNF